MGKIVRVQAIVNSKLKLVYKISTEIQRRSVKVMKRVRYEPGVITVSICHKENTMTVTGEHIDAVHLTIMVRKKFGYAELLWVDNKHKEKTENYKKPESSLPYHYDHTVGAFVAQPRYNNSDVRDPVPKFSNSSVI
ncbi:hypothetical protein IEQ34_022176 [Dendrobium chrysotoxum]|uniref:Uncharacterized protein n=1 Tax=Dendrobium chrysotoxum TaxID=161865 RepID=A0AAV7FWI8_DENCH|nr:hypothetical protein IEQ34_022176 [Dendrobium chrysotoxum]